MNAAETPPGFFHPSRAFYRGLVLLIAGLLTYGSYFAYDSVGALAPTLIQAWGTDRQAIGWLYTIYSVAGIVSVVFGGMLIDRIGTRRASLLFSCLIALGACLVAMAPGVGAACVGRFIFGAGSESLTVAQNAICARWFRDRELAMSFGVTITISRLGTLFSFNTESLLASRFGWRGALWAAAGFCVLSLAANLVYCWLDRRAEPVLGLKEDAGGGERIVAADIKRFGAPYLYVILLCFAFYSAVFPFTALSTDFFHEKWGLPLTTDAGGGLLSAAFSDFRHMFSTAPGTSSIIIFASMVLAPFVGRWVDRRGGRSRLMVAGALLMIPSYLLLGFTRLPPAWAMLLLGAAFVLVPAAMWPAVPLVVEKARVGTAFGVMTMLQNVGLALFPWLNGRLRDVTQDYRASMLMFAALGGVGLVFAVLLGLADRRAGSVLDRPGTSA